MSEWMSRVALETVGQTILGYSFDPLDSPYNNPYTSAVKELMLVQCPLITSSPFLMLNTPLISPTIFRLSLVRQFAPFLARLGPPAFRRKLVEWTPNDAVQKVKKMADVMHETAKAILEQKRQEITDGVEAGKDIISVLRKSFPSLYFLGRSWQCV